MRKLSFWKVLSETSLCEKKKEIKLKIYDSTPSTSLTSSPEKLHQCHLKISLYSGVYLKAILWRFCIPTSQNYRVIYSCSLYFS